MALVTVNGLQVFEARLCMPRTGVWHVDLLSSDGQVVVGPATINVNSGAVVLSGAAAMSRTGVFADTARARVAGGAGGMGLSAVPKHYTGTNVRIVLGDLLAAAGEKLSPTADVGILATGVDAFTVSANPIGTLLSQLLAAAAPGASWRMLTDGTLWVGRETWPDAGVDRTTYQIREDNAETRTMMIEVDAPLILVGKTFEGRRVSYTEATVGQGGDGITMRIWFEDAAAGDVTDVDRMRKAFAALAQASLARIDKIDYGRHYSARVVAQSGATIDVQPDQVGGKDLLPDMANVPLLLGLPGASVDGVQGGRVTVGWLGGDPSNPYAVAFDAESAVKKIVISVINQIFLGGEQGADPPALSTPLAGYLNLIANHFHPAPGGATSPSPTLSTVPDIAAKKVSVV
jgi:hypothetical protein